MNVLINGKEYSYGDVSVNALGRTFEGITAVSYGDATEKVNHYGRGNKPVSRGRGNYEANGSLTLAMKEVEGIQRALPRGSNLADIPPFDVNICYMPDDGSNVLVRHRMRACEFTGQQRELASGDTGFDIELTLVVAEIDWNV